MSRRRKSPLTRITRAFDRDQLKRVCEMHETDFGAAYGLKRFDVEERGLPSWSRFGDDEQFYYYQDNGSNILAVAHLDTVIDHARRTCTFVDTEAGPVVFSGALDDRLGAYIILDLLPKLGIRHDILLTTGEESGCSTAQYFDPPKGKDYHWMIEFDRGGSDVVMYEYDDFETRGLVRASGAQVDSGSFSDICYLDHLEIKGFNWGVGYRDYHGPRGHAWLNETFQMLAYYLKFHAANAEEYLPHDRFSSHSYGRYSGTGMGWSDGLSGMSDYDKWWERNTDPLIDSNLDLDLDPIDDLLPEQFRRIRAITSGIDQLAEDEANSDADTLAELDALAEAEVDGDSVIENPTADQMKQALGA